MKTKRLNLDRHGLLKLKTLLHTPKYVIITSGLEQIPCSMCPITLLHMDEQGNLWFITSKKNSFCKKIESDSRVQVIYSDEDTHNYITIYGNAESITDSEKMSELWTPLMYAWFKDREYSEMMLVRLRIETADYWDNQNNMLVSFFTNSKPRLDYSGSPITVLNTHGPVKLQ